MNKSMATFKQLLPLLLLPLAFVACDKASNPVAPTGSVITLSANPSRITPTGSSTITVTGFRPDGNRLNPGTQIRLATNLGSLSSNVVEIGADGFTSATLKGDGRTGDAAVSAKLTTDSTESTVTVNIAAAKPTVSIVLERTEVDPNEEMFVTFFARDENSLPLGAGQQIQVAATLGTIRVNGREVTSVVTDANGRAVAQFLAAGQSGTAKITAFLQNSDIATSDAITIRDAAVRFTLSQSTGNIAVGGTVSLTVVAFNASGLPARGVVVQFAAGKDKVVVNGREVGVTNALDGSFTSSTQLTGADGTVTTTFTFRDNNITIGTEFFLSAEVNLRGAAANEPTVRIATMKRN